MPADATRIVLPGGAIAERLMLASARGEKAFLAEVVAQASRDLASRDKLLKTARRFKVAERLDLDKAVEIAGLLQSGRPSGGGPLASPAMAMMTRGAPASVPGDAGARPAGRSAAVFNTWGYLAARPVPTDPSNEYGWAIARTDLRPEISMHSVASSAQTGATAQSARPWR